METSKFLEICEGVFHVFCGGGAWGRRCGYIITCGYWDVHGT